MTYQMHYQLEISGQTATLYVLASLGEPDVDAMLAACRALPTHVRTLRLDLQALGSVTADTLDVVRRILRQWRATRRGEVRLHTSHLQAACTDVDSSSAVSPGAGQFAVA